MLILPNDILNDTPADATPVEQNYSVIEQYINTQVINRDGSVAMTGQLHLFGDPLNVNDAARKGYVDALLPVGVMLPFCGQVAPAGSWALCNGAALQTATYPKLFAVLGYRYGGSGGTFNVPNMAGVFPIGMDATQTEFSATGKKGGTFTVPVPLHSHPMPHTHTINHDHAQFNTSENLSNHLHAITHDHAAFNTSDPLGGHRHTASLRQNSTPGNTGSYMTASATGTTVAGLTGYDDNPHVHQVNVPSYVGNSGANSGNHTHSANVPPYTGASGAVSTPNTSNAGTSGVEMQPPFVVVNYIVRVD